jgi:hypothetical protein
MTSATPPQPPVLTYRLTPQTLVAAQQSFMRRFWRHCPRSHRSTAMVLQVLMFAALGLLTAWGRGSDDSFGYWVLLWLVLFVLFCEMWQRLQLRVLAETALRNWGECALSWDESGLSSRSNGRDSHYDWNCVAEIYEGNAWITIFFGEAALHVPDSAFTPELSREAMVAQLRGFMGKARPQLAVPKAAQAIQAVQATPAEAPSEVGNEPGAEPPVSARIAAAPALPRATPGSFLHQLWRILTFRRPDARAFRPTLLTLFLPIPLFFLFLLIPEILRDGWPGELMWWNASSLLQPFAFMALAAGFMMAANSRDGRAWEDGGRFWLACNWLLLLVPPLVWFWNESEWFTEHPYTYIPVAVLCLLFIRQTEPLAENRRHPGQALLLATATYFALYIACATTDSYEANNLWVSSAEKASRENRPPRFRVDEDVLYGQPRLLDEHIAALAPGKAGQPETFFLGVAGYDQQVFLNEIRMARTLFADRFGTEGHALLLANNSGTAGELPFANRESLRRALAGLARRMNPEDVLFLFMTSHGSQERGFSLTLWPLNFTDIAPETLRELLDASGIERRIIVVSGCYSGQFIPALENDDSLVITASSADRTSFGCSDDDEFTDFGRAYFLEALHETHSFTEAFRLAADRIAQREKEQGRTPSLPQMAQGKNYRDTPER